MQNLIELLKITARKFPKNRAVIYNRKALTYREVVSDVVRLSLRLTRLHVRRNDHVGILLPNCSDFVISYFAILNREAVVVPLNNFLKPEELVVILKDCGIKFLITNSSFLKTVSNLAKEVNCLADILFIDQDISLALPFLKKEFADFGFSGLRSNAKKPDPAVILYTSGTTGYPKGAILSHGNLLFDVFACANAIEVSSRDNFICVLPMFHSFPQTVCMLLPFAKGATTTIIDGLKPFSKVLRAIVQHRVTAFVAVPAVYNILINLKLPRIFLWPIIKNILIPLRICVSGAAALPGETLKKFEERFGIPLLEGYGLTETSPVVSLNPYRHKRIPGSIGLPLAGISVKVVDDFGKELAPNTVGELLVKGENVMQGYFNRPADTHEALKDGWLYTGDLAKIDDKGFIYIVDRKKDMINVRGLKVYPREVEEVLCKHPDVQEAAVVGILDSHHGEIPKAFIVLKENSHIDERSILEYLRKHIANYKVPRNIEFSSNLPKTPTGKIAKRELIAAH
jgi:long-chain acyl-CoA synthetase